jgi:hypothetical protein
MSMSSLEVVSVGMLVFSFILYSCFVGIIGRLALKCSSLSFSAASSLSFYALICWILLLWLGVSLGGHQQGVGAIQGAVALEILFYPEPGETGWSGLPNKIVQFGYYCELAPASALTCVFSPWTLFYSSATPSRLFSMSRSISSLADVSLLDPI